MTGFKRKVAGYPIEASGDDGLKTKDAGY